MREVNTLINVSYRVYGLACDNQGNIYYTTNHPQLFKYSQKDSKNYCIHVFNAFLRGLVFDGEQSLIICDWQQQHVYYFHLPSKTVTKEFDITSPWGVTISPSGNFYIGAHSSIYELVWNSKQQLTRLNEGIACRLSSPAGLAASKDGSIYICDWGNNCVRKFQKLDSQNKYEVIKIENEIPPNTTGIDQDIYEDMTKMKCPSGITFLPNGDLLVVDTNSMWRIDTKSNKAFPINKYGGLCITTDSRNMIYVANTKIMRINSTWKKERLLWIAFMKETPQTCLLACLPRELIKEICNYLPYS